MKNLQDSTQDKERLLNWEVDNKAHMIVEERKVIKHLVHKVTIWKEEIASEDKIKKRTKTKLKCKEEINGEIPRWKEKKVISKKFHMKDKNKGKRVHVKGKDKKDHTREKDKDNKPLHSNEIMIEKEQINIREKIPVVKTKNFSNQDKSKTYLKRKGLLINEQVCKTIC